MDDGSCVCVHLRGFFWWQLIRPQSKEEEKFICEDSVCFGTWVEYVGHEFSQECYASSAISPPFIYFFNIILYCLHAWEFVLHVTLEQTQKAKELLFFPVVCRLFVIFLFILPLHLHLLLSVLLISPSSSPSPHSTLKSHTSDATLL